jgi:hypothetical protein
MLQFQLVFLYSLNESILFLSWVIIFFFRFESQFVLKWIPHQLKNDLTWNRIRKALENRTNLEDDRIAILEAQLAQAKLIAEEADKKYEEVKYS